jgi:hypothetical protein
MFTICEKKNKCCPLLQFHKFGSLAYSVYKAKKSEDFLWDLSDAGSAHHK